MSYRLPRIYKTAVAATPPVIPGGYMVVGVLALTATAVTLTDSAGNTIAITPPIGTFIPGAWALSSTTSVAFAMAPAVGC